MSRILIIAEHLNGQLNQSTAKCVSCASGIAGAEIEVVVLAADPAPIAAQAATIAGVSRVRTIANAANEQALAAVYAPQILAIAGDYTHVFGPSTTFGKDLMPRVGAKLEAGVASDISKVDIDGGELVYTRPMYAGNVIGQLKVTTDVQVVTVRQSEFEPAAESGGSSDTEEADVVEADVAGRVESLGIEVVQSERPDLSEADVVVSGGRSLKSAENFENVLEPLVDALGAAMGASRAAVDAGYVPNELQVGQTGKVVAPKLYIAVGISGAIQHLAGMKGSKVIVAVNKDKEAPIAQVADYFLVADLFDAVPALTAAVKKAKAG